jgi:uncharacterized protein YdhG (YjbR/CyaY superfamily)
MVDPNQVDAYIDSVSKHAQKNLNALRKAIIQAAPKAIERISYGMPYYAYKGRLAYFRLAKNHIGLYIPTPTIEDYKKEVGNYYASQATLHLPLDKKLPIALIKKLIKARMEYNKSTEKHVKSILNKLKNKRSVAS